MLRITVLRNEKGWSRSELARRAKLQPSDISKIENGRMRPYDGQLRRIARALKVADSDADGLLCEIGAGDGNA
jgi:transcriptional regulator with XRE-family HTH domain